MSTMTTTASAVNYPSVTREP